MVIEAFVKQTMVSTPLEYIKTVALDTGKWMPIHFFIRKSKKTLDEIKIFLKDLIRAEGKNYPQGTIDMLSSEKIPSCGRKRDKTKIESIKRKEIMSITTKEDALTFIASVEDVKKEDLDLKYCLKILQSIVNQFWNEKEIQSKVKYCCAYLDRLYYYNGKM